MKKIWFTYSLMIYSLIGFSQNPVFSDAVKAYEDRSYAMAIDLFKKKMKKHQPLALEYEMLAESYYWNSSYKEATRWYQHWYDTKKSVPNTESLFRFAKCLISIGEKERAKVVLNDFRAKTNESDLRRKLLEEVPNWLENIGDPYESFSVATAKFSTKDSEFAPAFYDSLIVFSKSSKKVKQRFVRDAWTKQGFNDLYIVDPNNDKKPRVKPFVRRFNSPLHEATAVFTKDKKTVYFTRSSIQHGKTQKDDRGTIQLNIFKSTRKRKKWSKPKKIALCNQYYSIAHPALNANETRLYFVSDMPGGFGKSDIYYAPINSNGKFGRAQNLGPSVNTAGRESFPFVSSSNTLYFSSDGLLGLGGYDVYKLKLEKSSMVPIHLGSPVNSNKDDISFIIDEGTNSGYFASDRKGNDDIFRFERREEIPMPKQIELVVLDKEHILQKNIELRFLIDQSKDTLVATTNMQGRLYLEVLPFQTISYLTNDSIKEKAATYRVKNQKHQIWELEIEHSKPDIGVDLLKVLHLSEVFFKTNSSYIDHSQISADVARLMKVLHHYSSLKIEIRAHTDSRGSEAYNLWLSDRRAKRIKNYLVKHGIAPDRLHTKGMGESNMLVPCQGKKCKAEDHRTNRRTEFIVISN
ncbi:MAG: OmpA family protein [Flavobacteriaceae bacterium]|nr:OmpA family protein [Flavobacteriaceae bacterium]